MMVLSVDLSRYVSLPRVKLIWVSKSIFLNPSALSVLPTALMFSPTIDSRRRSMFSSVRLIGAFSQQQRMRVSDRSEINFFINCFIVLG